MTRRVVVLGASGFIGRNIAERLAARADLEVSGTWCRTPPSGSPAQPSRLRLVQADLTRPDDVERAIRGQDVVIQAAAVTTGSKDIVTRPYLHVTDNAVMNSLIFRACFEHRVQQVVFFSCTTMYAQQPTPVKEDDFNGQIIPKYFGVGWTKVYIEKLCEFYAGLGPTRYAALRHSNIYGPYDKFDLDRSHVFGATVTKVLTAHDGTITVWGDGSEARDLLYVSDLVELVERLLDTQRDPFELLNVGSGQAVTVRELVEQIIRASGRDVSILFDRSKPTIPFTIALDTSRARQRYGWSPRVSLEEGIRRTLAWYRDHPPAELAATPAGNAA